jgi:hypothetical protein
VKEKEFSSRKEAAEYVAANYKRFKVCEGCDSVLAKTLAMCPICYTYRFDASKEAVINTSTRLGNNDRSTLLDSDLF